jgi:hypothetical protein
MPRPSPVLIVLPRNVELLIDNFHGSFRDDEHPLTHFTWHSVCIGLSISQNIFVLAHFLSHGDEDILNLQKYGTAMNIDELRPFSGKSRAVRVSSIFSSFTAIRLVPCFLDLLEVDLIEGTTKIRKIL